ncbi:MAG: VWA domain-containing protein [Sulfolobaceae archaeon]
MSLNLFSSSAQKIAKEVQDYSALQQNQEYLINYINNAKLIADYWKELKPKNLHTSFKHYQRHDLFNLFYSSHVSFNNKSTAWSSLLKSITKQLEFIKIKKYTERDEELSALMTVKMLIRILQEMEKSKQQQNQQQGQGNQIQQIVNAVKDELRVSYQQVQEYKEGKEEIQQLIVMIGGSGGNAFSHDSLSLLKYLQKPDELRIRIEMLKSTFTWLRKFSTELPASFKKAQLSSDQGEINCIEKLMRETQITHMISSEYSYLALSKNSNLARILFSLRYVNKELLVYRGSASPKVSLYIDKSGSMSMPLEGVPKISLATGLGLAMLKKFDDTKIFMFDTEVTEVDKNKMVQTLLTIAADGGTNISAVLQKIKEVDDRKTIHIVISDGIDDVSENVIKSIPNQLRKRIAFILIEANAPQWLQKNFRYYLVKTIVDFQQAVTKSLQSQV